jgi:O-antigen/teichoic acid export membrane protein
MIGALGCVLAVASYFALVPPFGIIGACLASVCAYAALSVATVMTLRARLRDDPLPVVDFAAALELPDGPVSG